jgi:hypothetical protein
MMGHGMCLPHLFQLLFLKVYIFILCGWWLAFIFVKFKSKSIYIEGGGGNTKGHKAPRKQSRVGGKARAWDTSGAFSKFLNARIWKAKPP